MNISYIDGLIIPMITVASLCVGYVMKHWLPTDDRWIPTVLLFFGAISGIILFGWDYEGIVKGMVSGLSAVGLHQAFKQHLSSPMGSDELYAMGQYHSIAEIDEEMEYGDE
jgi:hypothetical protein